MLEPNIKAFLLMTQDERLCLINSLNIIRATLLNESKQKASAKKSVVKKTKPKLVFASAELEAIFNKMPKECQNLLLGK